MVHEGKLGDPSQRASLEWSLDGIKWRLISALTIPQTRMQWDGSVDGEVVCLEPSERVYIRACSETALSTFEFYGHLDISHAHSGALRVRHHWVEDAAATTAVSSTGNKERRCEFAAPSSAREYQVLCGRNPRDHSFEMAVDSIPNS